MAAHTRTTEEPWLEKSFLLDQCAQVESNCAEVYRHFAGIHADSHQLAALWKTTADEEDNHAQAFRTMGRMKGEGSVGVDADPTGVAAALKKLQSLMELLKTSTLPPVEALKLALRMETYLSQFHVNVVALCHDAEMRNLLSAMMNHDLEHIETLERALEQHVATHQGHPELHVKLQALIGEMQAAHLSLDEVVKLELEFQAFLKEQYAVLPAGDAVGMRELIEAAHSNHADLGRLLESRLNTLE